MKILLTEGNNKAVLGIIRNIGLKHDVDVIATVKNYIIHSKYCNSLKIIKNCHDEALYVESLVQILNETKYDLIIPVGARSVKYISRQIERINKLTKVFVADIDSIEIALNTGKTFEHAKESSVLVPKTYGFDSLQDVEKNKSTIEYPIIVKSSDESLFKFETIYVNNYVELMNALYDCNAKYPQILENKFPIIQEKVIGKGFGFFALYNKGQCVSYFMHERLREYPFTGGASTCARSVYDKDLLKTGMKLLDSLNWHGLAMVEYKKDEKSDEFKLIEINPKIWGSFELSIKCGVDFIQDVISLTQKENIIQRKNYALHKRFQWIFSYKGDIDRLEQRKRDFFYVIADILNPWVFSEISMKDLKPNYLQIKASIKRLISR